MRYILLLVMTIGCVFSAELPREAQRELDSFQNAVSKADAVRQAAVNVAVDKACKALNEVAKKADTAEERRAIDDQILSLKKLRKDVDLLGESKPPAMSVLGRWASAWPGGSGTLAFLPDGVIGEGRNGYNDRWVLEANALSILNSSGGVHAKFKLEDGRWVDPRGLTLTKIKDNP